MGRKEGKFSVSCSSIKRAQYFISIIWTGKYDYEWTNSRVYSAARPYSLTESMRFAWNTGSHVSTENVVSCRSSSKAGHVRIDCQLRVLLLVPCFSSSSSHLLFVHYLRTSFVSSSGSKLI